MAVLLCALLAALAAWALTGFMRSCATSDAAILRSRAQLPVAAVLGGLAGLAHSWAEMLAFVVLAVASGLLTVIDLAEERLPDRIVLPLIGLTAGLLTLAAWTTGEWSALGRAGLAAVALFVLYFVMMVFSPDLGFGDVKLAAVAGAFGGWFGWGAVVLGFGAGWITFAIAGLALMVARRRGRKGSFAFGPFLILGAVLGVFWAGAVLSW
ncbi:prepilin peptidase [Propionicimonas sp.]|uniref:prepilin peptidase n=1 Tax=Propionicimonas sp. TaxID=1955623 RepID=UPI0039E6713C